MSASGNRVAGKSVQYVNRRGDTYYLHEGRTKTGKPKWFFSKRADGALVESLPEGYEIYENHLAQVFLRVMVSSLVTKAEIEEVEAGVRELADVRHFLVEGRSDTITIFIADQEPSFFEERLATSFGVPREMLASLTQQRLHYAPHMRFTLRDENQRRFAAERWCFRGSIDGWLPLCGSGDLATVVRQFVPHLGRQSFYELI